jgi:hypothetical protein
VTSRRFGASSVYVNLPVSSWVRSLALSCASTSAEDPPMISWAYWRARSTSSSAISLRRAGDIPIVARTETLSEALPGVISTFGDGVKSV